MSQFAPNLTPDIREGLPLASGALPVGCVYMPVGLPELPVEQKSAPVSCIRVPVGQHGSSEALHLAGESCRWGWVIAGDSRELPVTAWANARVEPSA
jgi:hypothetical protein